MRLVRLLLLALAGLAVLAPTAGAADPKKSKAAKAAHKRLLKKVPPVRGPLRAKIGIADQKPEFFADPRFRRLNIRIARRSVAWDAMEYDWQVADLDAWVDAAARAGVQPLITFARSRIAEKRHMKPTPVQISQGFLAFRRRYPWITEFVASNESNHYGEPTGRNPRLAAQHYRAMRGACPQCRIAAATLLDQPNLVKWAKAFIRHAREKPRYWALHNYVSANRFDATRTLELLASIKGEIWLTEVGGLVKRRTPDRPGKARLTEGVNHAAKVTRYIFDELLRVSPRITRAYLYHWNAEGPLATWDSGLVGDDGTPRPAYSIFESALRAIRSGRVPKRVTQPKTKKPKRDPDIVVVGGEVVA